MKTSRIPSPTLVQFGLFAIIESKRVILPLKGVECDLSVVSGVAEVSMTQVFRQENEKPLDCEYLFPLPADASVYFCEADINGRTIRAQVRERQEARQIAAEKKAAGFRTALVESERENLFTLSLGNVQPGDLVVIHLKYFQTLRSLAGMPSIEIPLCPGIRYIPGKPLLRSNKGKGTADDTDEVPDASRITPVRIDADHPDAAYIEVRGTLDASFVNEADLASPSHPIAVCRTGSELRVTLSDKGDVPDRDFVLRWTEKSAASVASRVWVREKGDETFALLEIRAPKDAPSERAPVDFYFLIDRSGSMAGEKWNKAAQALQNCMKVLAPTDRAMITFFETRYQDFAERPLLVQDILRDKQFERIAKLGTAGGTEMRPALKHVLDVAGKHSDGRTRNLILITDAQIGNESAILDLLKTASGFPVHCFGIDVALNDSLLLALCRQQGGTFYSLNPNDDIEQAVTALGKTLGQPVLLDLQLSDGWETADASIPNLYAGQIHYLSARSSNVRVPRLKARTAMNESITIEFEQRSATVDAPYLHWCRSRIQRLVAEGKEKAAIALSIESNLICQLTAFLAWDESEKVIVADHQLVQPSLELHAAKFCLAEAGVMRAAGAPALSIDRVATKRSRGGGLFRRFFHEDRDETISLSDSAGRDELDLKRELSDICHRACVPDWQAIVKAIFDWISEASAAEQARRIEATTDLIRKVKLYADKLATLRIPQEQTEADEIRKQITALLKHFAESLRAAR